MLHFEQILLSDPAARHYFVRYCHLETELLLQFLAQHPRQSKPEARNLGDGRKDQGPSNAPQPDRCYSGNVSLQSGLQPPHTSEMTGMRCRRINYRTRPRS